MSRRYHVVHFNIAKNPDIMAWLKAQKSEPESLAQLIRLAQALEGNTDWMQASPAILGKLMKGIPSKVQSSNAPESHSNASIPVSSGNPTQRVRKTSITSNNDHDSDNKLPKPNFNFKKNGFGGF